MIDPNAPAYPMPSGPEPRVDTFTHYNEGMTIRATMAKDLMGGLLANAGGPIQANGINGWGFTNCDVDQVAQVAVTCADALIAELNKTEVKP